LADVMEFAGGHEEAADALDQAIAVYERKGSVAAIDRVRAPSDRKHASAHRQARRVGTCKSSVWARIATSSIGDASGGAAVVRRPGDAVSSERRCLGGSDRGPETLGGRRRPGARRQASKLTSLVAPTRSRDEARRRRLRSAAYEWPKGLKTRFKLKGR